VSDQNDFEIAREIGGLRQAVEDSRIGRHELKEELMHVRQAINGLQQSNIATNTILAELATQNLASRVAKNERAIEDMQHILLTQEQAAFVIRLQKWAGNGSAFAWRIFTGWLGSAAVAGAVVAYFLRGK
jgi:chromosome condensin MukBEF ATPase and DNA-binding subunit MukB